MSTDITIREAAVRDLPSVLALYAEPEIDAGDVLSVPEAERIFERYRQYPDYRLFVAVDGERVVGTFALLIADNLAHRGARSGLVEDVVVAGAVRRRGVGKQMMVFALDRCREAGCYKMALSSSVMRPAAHRFYEALGFAKHGYSFGVDLGQPAGGGSSRAVPGTVP